MDDPVVKIEQASGPLSHTIASFQVTRLDGQTSFGHDIHNKGQDALKAGLLEAVKGSETYPVDARTTIEAGVFLALKVVENWSSGDLASAVNALEEWANLTKDAFPALDFTDDDDEEGDE